MGMCGHIPSEVHCTATPPSTPSAPQNRASLPKVPLVATNRCTAHPLYGSIGLEENTLRQSHLIWRLMGLVPVLDHNKMFVTDQNGIKRRANKFEISRCEEQLFHQCVWLLLEKSVEELASGGRFVYCGDDAVRKFFSKLHNGHIHVQICVK